MNLHQKVEVKKKSSALETLCFYGLRLSESTLKEKEVATGVV